MAVTSVDQVLAGQVTTKGRPSGRRRKSASVSHWERFHPYIFLLPFLVTFIVFTVGPVIYSIYLSLFSTPLIGPRRFVGIQNFVKAVHDPSFWNGVERVVIFGVIQVPIMLLIALFFAVVFDLNLVRRGAGALRLIYFLPYAIPGVISALMWGYLYEPRFSPFDTILGQLGLGHPNLVSGGLVLPAIGNIVTWEYVGYNMVILYVALRSSPAELVDAAVVDGAKLWDIVRYIKVPMARIGLFLTAILSIIGTLQLFTEPEIISAFSPAVNSYYTPNIYIYTVAFTNNNLDYAAALSIVIGVITIVGTLVFIGFNSWRHRLQV